MLTSTWFQQSFVNWMQAVSERSNGELIAIDGKVLRGSYDREARLSTIHMVSAFVTVNGFVQGLVKTDEKSNEIKANPELLNLLDIKGCLVLIDAIACQTNIASAIVDKGGDGVFQDSCHLFFFSRYIFLTFLFNLPFQDLR